MGAFVLNLTPEQREGHSPSLEIAPVTRIHDASARHTLTTLDLIRASMTHLEGRRSVEWEKKGAGWPGIGRGVMEFASHPMSRPANHIPPFTPFPPCSPSAYLDQLPTPSSPCAWGGDPTVRGLITLSIRDREVHRDPPDNHIIALSRPPSIESQPASVPACSPPTRTSSNITRVIKPWRCSILCSFDPWRWLHKAQELLLPPPRGAVVPPLPPQMPLAFLTLSTLPVRQVRGANVVDSDRCPAQGDQPGRSLSQRARLPNLQAPIFAWLTSCRASAAIDRAEPTIGLVALAIVAQKTSPLRPQSS